eukprot:symbB.v1.2.029436.t1/scaffold3213.1/size61021/1
MPDPSLPVVPSGTPRGPVHRVRKGRGALTINAESGPSPSQGAKRFIPQSSWSSVKSERTCPPSSNTGKPRCIKSQCGIGAQSQSRPKSAWSSVKSERTCPPSSNIRCIKYQCGIGAPQSRPQSCWSSVKSERTCPPISNTDKLRCIKYQCGIAVPVKELAQRRTEVESPGMRPVKFHRSQVRK